ncbi:acid protease [Leucogyrophana mollusca]|uniref:Acid protease n=1 Tax=Leucogyrophana mollusca TaxID=85980 RepID=A0ACB8B0L3_9AGAM|nr:acid protease [Leucogyrophana mollusca]
MRTSYRLLILVLLVTGVSPWPIRDPSERRNVSSKYHLAKLRRPFIRKATIDGVGGIPLFNPAYAKKELQSVMQKYAKASDYLQGIDLAPDPSVLDPLVDAEADADAATSVSGTLVSAAADSELPVPLVDARPTSQTANNPLTDDISGSLDLEYYGPLQFGTQQLTFDVDTGSADLWIPVGCDMCNNGQFDPTTSRAYVNTGTPFNVTYGVGEVRGTLAHDTVTVGSLPATSQYFGAVSQVSDDFNDTPSDGLIGLAFGSIASSRHPTFFETLMTQRRVAAPLFSIFLARKEAHGSEICFGCYDVTKTIGPITWVPVKSRTYWSVSMDGLFVNGMTMPVVVTAAIDTGTTLIYVPDLVARQLYNQIPGSQKESGVFDGFYSYPCSSYPSISLSFDGKAFELSTLDFNLGRLSSDSDRCIGGILSLGDGFGDDFAIIGDEFLKSWYSTYDYSHGGRVGFSPSINNRVVG